VPAPAIDSHAHLYFDRFNDDRDEVIQRAKDAGFVAIINIAVDEQTSRQVIQLAMENEGFCHAVVGVHPTHSGMSADDLKTTLAAVEKLCDEHPQQVVGIGEIGLDYYWKEVSPADQERAFIAQLDIARRRKLPVVIHCREAWPDTLAVIEKHGVGVTGVFHCFGGTVEEAQRALDLGCLSEGARSARCGGDRSSRPVAAGNRQPVSGATTEAWKTQRTCALAPHR